MSSMAKPWPQHVLLADEAFAADAELREQLVHELAHQWLYLIEDIWPLDRPAAGAATSLRLDGPGPGLGLGLDPAEVDAYLDAVDAGLIVQETRCDKGMQDNFALRTGTTVQLA